ncbi:MAG: hypothetical protein EAZ09_02850 [Oscillatoriales cyanobacterium]|nr:MAG: hypothetical protein EAZ18_23250 [Oscillatoriales cyanobacterium]TAH25011.1 MAG: hypothetical protein EAZ09_02850 [Oscillatoriales cyanobacterium]
MSGGQDARPTRVSEVFAVCDRVYGAIADNPFPDNAKAMSALQVIAIDFGKFICLFPTISVIILYI